VLGGPKRSLLIDGANPYHFRSIQCFEQNVRIKSAEKNTVLSSERRALGGTELNCKQTNLTTQGQPDLEGWKPNLRPPGPLSAVRGLRQLLRASTMPAAALGASASYSGLLPAAMGRRQLLGAVASCSGPPPAAQGYRQPLRVAASCSRPL
jgi:hypothetical protein